MVQTRCGVHILSYIMANYKEILALGDKVDGSRNSATMNKKRADYTLHYVSVCTKTTSPLTVLQSRQCPLTLSVLEYFAAHSRIVFAFHLINIHTAAYGSNQGGEVPNMQRW
jgi:hypothetical protein